MNYPETITGFICGHKLGGGGVNHARKVMNWFARNVNSTQSMESKWQKRLKFRKSEGVTSLESEVYHKKSRKKSGKKIWKKRSEKVGKKSRVKGQQKVEKKVVKKVGKIVEKKVGEKVRMQEKRQNAGKTSGENQNCKCNLIILNGLRR